MLAGPALIEGVERTNAVIVCPNQQTGFIPYVMDVDRERNCYSCEGFGHLVQNCRRQIMG